ncbi:DinB family protein [Eudoraea adriatica]|uniref:DinB family protein n=1 Tax=Eudoraea adriatica TaxID=446681 RepID=UPI00036396F0|nr:DinB family protein [Eudoraea adriatica]
MENAGELAKRFKEVILNGKWIANTNYKDQLNNVSWEQATTKIGSLNTIAALAFHINYYISGILDVFKGGELVIRDKYSFDMPEIKSIEDWDQLLNEIWNNAEHFAGHVENMTQEKLEEFFVKEEYGTYRRSIEGVIEHSYYHLGQISLIKKMIQQAD